MRERLACAIHHGLPQRKSFSNMEIKCKKKHFSLKPLGNQKLFYLEVYKNGWDTNGFVQHPMQNKTVKEKTLHIENNIQ